MNVKIQTLRMAMSIRLGPSEVFSISTDRPEFKGTQMFADIERQLVTIEHRGEDYVVPMQGNVVFLKLEKPKKKPRGRNNKSLDEHIGSVGASA